MSLLDGGSVQHLRFIQLLGSRRSQFLRYSLSLTGNRDDAEDLLQESIVKALTAIACLREDAAFETWFLRLMKNTFIDSRRRRKLADQLSFGAAWPGLAAMDPAYARWAVTPDQVIISYYMTDTVRRAIEKLPDEHSQVILLHYVLGYSIPEIVDITGEADGTIRSRVSRALSKLRHLLMQGAEE